MAGIDLHCHTIIDLDPLIRIGGGWVIISRQIWDAQFSFFQISAMVFAVLSFCSLLTLAFVKVTECYKFAFTQTNYKKIPNDCQESPSWLLRHGRRVEAETSLFFYRGCQQTVKEELCSMEDNVKEESDSSVPLAKVPGLSFYIL